MGWFVCVYLPFDALYPFIYRLTYLFVVTHIFNYLRPIKVFKETVHHTVSVCP